MLNRKKQTLVMFTIAMLVFALLPTAIFAASTGQIKGTVTNKDGEPVVSASVLLVGTTTGSVTDFDGKFTIRLVEPGTYSIRISHLDYATNEVTKIIVKSDFTTEANAKLKSKDATELGVTIVTIAEQKIIDPFVTGSQVVISKEEISRRPVTSVDELLTQVAGVTKGQGGEVFIRGGRAGEVAYIVDGVPIGDPLGGLGQAGAQLSLVSGSIQEFQIIKDGFDPEYGDALSGIVKIKTNTGSKDNTNVNIQYITDDFGNAKLNEYSRNSDYLRFALSGPDPLLKDKILPAIGLGFLAEKEFTYYFYAELDKNDGTRKYQDYNTPTTQVDYGELNILGVNIPSRANNKYYWMTNLQFRPKPTLKLILSYKDSQDRRTVFDWSKIYTGQYSNVYENKWRSLSLEVSQSISKDMSYEAIFSLTKTSVTQKPGDPDNPGKGLNPDQMKLDSEWEDYDDLNGNGKYDAPEPIFNLFPDTAIYGDGITGPAYTWGEFNQDMNAQNGQSNGLSDFRFNNNGTMDFSEGEPFIDLNGNGVWDRGDYLKDRNGNGIYDQDLISPINRREEEPFINGDSIIGEPFSDVNANGIYDRGIDIFIKSTGPDNMDLNHNGKYDGPEISPLQWSPGIPYMDRNGNGLFDPPNNGYDQGEPFTDWNGNGVHDLSKFLLPNSYAAEPIWHHRENTTIRGEVKIFRQFGNHEVKGGMAMYQNDFTFQEIENPHILYTGRPDSVEGLPTPYPDRGTFRDMYKYNPWGGTGYIRDKIEYGSMIASLGFRWDYFIQDKYDLVEIAKNDDAGEGIILGDRQKISPRIGFSYPISDKAKVHFNYGHFFQLPQLSLMYSRNTSAVNTNKVIGNYNLDYQKTIQYSFGVKYAMSENYSVDFSGYFKDEFDKISSQQVRDGLFTRQQYKNADYGRGRGIEVTVEKRGGGYVSGMLSYTYAFAFGKASQTNQDYLTDFELSRDPLSEAALDNDVRHSLKSSIQVYVPSTVKPRMFGVPIPNGWSMSVETLIESGRPFTPSRDYPGISKNFAENIQRNSLRKPSVIYFDVRFTKDFTVATLDLKAILWVENIFDNKNVVGVYSNTGRPDTEQNISQIIREGTAFDQNPFNWDYGRQVRLGIELNL